MSSENNHAPNNKDSLVNAALQYASQGWYVIPLNNPIDGECSCGDKKCPKIGKHPRGGFSWKKATIEEKIIRQWWDNCVIRAMPISDSVSCRSLIPFHADR